MNKTGQLTAMISSTAADLPEHRRLVVDACLRQGIFPIGMEQLPARDATGIQVSLEMVDKADIYIGIYAWRYGWVPDFDNPGQISITEMEFNRALERKSCGELKEVLIFVMDEDHPIRPSDKEDGAEAQSKLKKLKERASSGRVRLTFKSAEELRSHVIQSLADAKLRIESTTGDPAPVADEIEDKVTVSCAVQIQKEAQGSYRDPESCSGLLPITDRDVFRLVICCRPQAHVYVAWVDSIGKVVPLFPWLPTEGWQDSKATQRDIARPELILTDDYVDLLPPNACRFQSRGRSGAETILVLARRNPIPLKDLEEMFTKLSFRLRGRKRIRYRDPNLIERARVVRSSTYNQPTLRAFGLAPTSAKDSLDILMDAFTDLITFQIDDGMLIVIPSNAGESREENTAL